MATRQAQRLIKEARNGDAQAQVSLGKLYQSGGEGLAANHIAALHWFSLAAREGVTEADALIAESIALDRAGSEIHHYWDACQRAADEGHAAGYCALGDLYASQAEAADLGKARTAYRVAAQAGYPAAARKLGMLLANDSGLDSDSSHVNAEAVQWLQTAAAAGDQWAVQGLGKLLWHNGDYQAARWLEPEAQKGDLDAMYRLGEILCAQADARQAQRGAHWLERAARKGHGRALWRYGRLHVKYFSDVPTGLPHSPLQASRLLERAAAAGVSEAFWDLARIYEMPRFSRRNLGRAREYLEQAATAGICEAELELGKRLSRYKNDRNAWREAGRWLSRARDQGSAEAGAILGRIADRALDWSASEIRRQEDALHNIRGANPTIAARLELAARFGLSAREMLFINPLELDRGWCIEVDLFRYFKRMPWRMVIIESAEQRQALNRACEAFLAADISDLALAASTTTGRARQLKAICTRLEADPSLFVRNWESCTTPVDGEDSPAETLQTFRPDAASPR